MASATQQSFTKLPTSSKLIVGGLLLLMTAGAYYATLHSSVTEDIEQAHRKQIRLQEQLQKEKKLQREFVRLREELESRKTTDQDNLRVLPETAEIATILQDLNRLAELSGLDIQSVRPEKERTEEFYVRIPVRLSVSGRYHQLAKFFHNVSRLQRAINIEDIKIRSPERRGDDIILSVDVMASTFRRNPEGKS